MDHHIQSIYYALQNLGLPTCKVEVSAITFTYLFGEMLPIVHVLNCKQCQLLVLLNLEKQEAKEGSGKMAQSIT